jgi:hypothetical protein
MQPVARIEELPSEVRRENRNEPVKDAFLQQPRYQELVAAGMTDEAARKLTPRTAYWEVILEQTLSEQARGADVTLRLSEFHRAVRSHCRSSLTEDETLLFSQKFGQLWGSDDLVPAETSRVQ